MKAARKLSSMRVPTGPKPEPPACIVGAPLRDAPAAEAGGGDGDGGGGGGGGGVLEVDRAAALRFIMLSMLRKPLLRPGVSDCSRPENLMNSGCTRWI